MADPKSHTHRRAQSRCSDHERVRCTLVKRRGVALQTDQLGPRACVAVKALAVADDAIDLGLLRRRRIDVGVRVANEDIVLAPEASSLAHPPTPAIVQIAHEKTVGRPRNFRLSKRSLEAHL